MTADMQKNLDILNSFKNLDNNWNGYSALKITDEVINHARDLLLSLNKQPDIFPTGCNTIQFEYEKDNGDYLEFEIFNDSVIAFQIISGKESESSITDKEVITMVNDFHK